MRRSKQLQKLVDDVNDYLRKNHIKSQSDPCFLVVSDSLLKQHLYQGYNFYVDFEVTYWDGYKTKIPRLAGTSDPEKFDYLQLY